MPDAPPPEEDFVVYPDKRKALKALNKRMLFIMLPMILFVFVVFDGLYYGIPALVARASGAPSPAVLRASVPATFSFMLWLPWLLVVEMAFLYPFMRRKISRQSKPIAVLSRDGIQVDTLGTHIGLIRWDEIAEIRPYKLFYRFIGIVPRDSALLAKRLPASSALLLRLNVWCIPLYKLFGRFVAPINIPEQYLPISGDEMLQRIRAYQTAYSRPVSYDAPQEGVWPPPPRPFR